jgi:hypothetical protein
MMLRDLQDLPDKAPIFELNGKITQVWEPRTGRSTYGEWRKVPFEIQDDDGESMFGVWWTSDGVLHEGDVVHLNAKPNKKGGISGCKISDYDAKDGSLRREISVSNECLVVLESAVPGSAAQPQASGGGAPAGGTHVNPSGATASPPPSSPTPPRRRLTDHDVLDAAGEYSKWFREVCKFKEDAAVAACVNTVLIALTQGRIDRDFTDDGEEEDDGD